MSEAEFGMKMAALSENDRKLVEDLITKLLDKQKTA